MGHVGKEQRADLQKRWVMTKPETSTMGRKRERERTMEGRQQHAAVPSRLQRSVAWRSGSGVFSPNFSARAAYGQKRFRQSEAHAAYGTQSTQSKGGAGSSPRQLTPNGPEEMRRQNREMPPGTSPHGDTAPLWKRGPLRTARSAWHGAEPIRMRTPTTRLPQRARAKEAGRVQVRGEGGRLVYMP